MTGNVTLFFGFMRQSNMFLGLTILVAALILIVYGIASLSPLNPTKNAVNDAGVTATPLDKPTVSFGNPSRGPKDAKVVIFVFGDYLCAPCADFDVTLGQALKDYPKDVRVVWKDMPNEKSHSGATVAAVAARCAGDQGGFWQYHDLMMQQQAMVDPKNYVPLAAQLNLDLDAFQSCLDGKTTQPLVQRDFDEGQRLRVDSTPFAFIGGRRVAGAISYEQLHGFIEAALAESVGSMAPKTAAP